MGTPFSKQLLAMPNPESRPRALEGQNKAEFQSEQPQGAPTLHHGLPISSGEEAGSLLTRPTCLCLLSMRVGRLTLRELAQSLAFPGFPHALSLPPQEMA